MIKPLSEDTNIDLDSLSSAVETPEDSLESKRKTEIYDATQECSDSIKQDLNDEDRFILERKYVNNRSVSEIARLLQKKRHVIERRLQSILTTIKKCITEKGITSDEINKVFY